MDSTMAAAAHVLMTGPISRADLARDLEVSAGALTRIVRPLVDSGLLVENRMGISASGMGRPTQLLEVPPSQHAFIGINLTSTMIHAVLVDGRCRVTDYRALPIHSRDPDDVAALISSSIDELSSRTPDGALLNGCGISVGGSIIDDRVTSRFLGWSDVDLLSLVRLPEHVTPLIVNDLDGLTMLEQWFGIGRHTHNFAVLTVGAGIGHGLIHERRRVTSPAGGHGMTSHLPVAGASGVCQYGHIGCADGALTTPAVLSRARSGRAIVSDDCRPHDMKDLVLLADRGDLACRNAIAEYSRLLATYLDAIARAALVLDVVIDGEGVALLDTTWATPLEQSLSAYDNPNIPRLRIHRRSGTFDRWARGAATAAIVQWLRARVADVD